MRRLLLIFISAAAAGSACDFITPGECLDRGQMFGPCESNTCAPGLLCMATTQGSLCTPPLETIGDTNAEECALWRGTFGIKCSEEWQLCYIPCAHDGHCIGGTVCAEDWKMCVYPSNPDDIKPPDGTEMGPCDSMGECDSPENVCAESAEGSICLNKDKADWLVPCGDGCPNGQVCGSDVGFCVWPQ